MRVIKIVFSFTGVYVLVKLFDFLLDRTRIKENAKTERARLRKEETGEQQAKN